MEKKPIPEIDAMMIPDSTQILKTLIPFLPSDKQMLFCMLVKIMELQSVMQYFGSHHRFSNKSSHDMECMISGIKPYVNDSAASMIDMFLQFYSMKDLLNGMDLSNFNMEDLKNFGFGDAKTEPENSYDQVVPHGGMEKQSPS